MLPASQIAAIYKNRWMIELLFKQIKQNFPLRYFWGNSINAIKIQVYYVLIAQLLLVVIRKKAATKKSFANMITVIRLHLMSYVDLLMFIKDSYKAWRKTHPLAGRAGNDSFAFATFKKGATPDIETTSFYRVIFCNKRLHTFKTRFYSDKND